MYVATNSTAAAGSSVTSASSAPCGAAGLGCADSVPCSCSGARRGIGDLSSILGGLNLQTVLLVLLGGFVLYRLLFGAQAKARRNELRDADREYRAARQRIIAKYPRKALS